MAGAQRFDASRQFQVTVTSKVTVTSGFNMWNMAQQIYPYATLTSSGDTDVALERRTTSHDTDDSRWKVIAHDDNVTTMEFVVRIMVQIFKKPLILAEAIMWQVHNEGQSVVDVLPKAEAERRVRQATTAARLEGFPFHFTIEPEQE
jgi:ATP-dependent Clp protease adaptor protein ClpS